MVEKVIDIGGVPTKMACSADTLRRYRTETGRDLLADLKSLSTGTIDTACLEDLAYIMAQQGGSADDMTIGEWLDQYGPLDIVNASAQIIELWGVNMQTSSKSKKK